MPKSVKAASASRSGTTPSTPRLDRDSAATRLVAAAMRLLADKGPTELRVRTVADAAGLTTIAVYHHLGGLPELVNAVVEQGFHDLTEELGGTPTTEDPVSALFAMALVSRRFAQASPHLYDLMFGLSTRGTYRPAGSSGNVRAANFQQAYAQLLTACDRLVASGRVRADEDPEAVALQLWSAVHGFITLELGGHLAHFDDPVRRVLLPAMVNIAVGLGDDARSALASHISALAMLS